MRNARKMSARRRMDLPPVSPANHANEFKRKLLLASIRVTRGPNLDSGLVESARIAHGPEPPVQIIGLRLPGSPLPATAMRIRVESCSQFSIFPSQFPNFSSSIILRNRSSISGASFNCKRVGSTGCQPVVVGSLPPTFNGRLWSDACNSASCRDEQASSLCSPENRAVRPIAEQPGHQ